MFHKRLGHFVRCCGLQITKKSSNWRSMVELFQHVSITFQCCVSRLLSLKRNELTSLPESFGELTSLQLLGWKTALVLGADGKQHRWLLLQHNQLTFLPKSVGNLKNLRHRFFHDGVGGGCREIHGNPYEYVAKWYTGTIQNLTTVWLQRN